MRRFNLFLAIGVLALPLAARAADLQTTPSSSTTTSETTQQRVTNLKTHGTAEIARRLTTLSSLLTKVQASTKLDSVDRSALAVQIQTEITDLTNLKSKIAADTELTILRADVQSIITEYRTYRLLVPKAGIERVADVVNELAGKFQTYVTDLQDRINKAEASGKDVTALKADIADMQAKVADAQTKAVQALNDVKDLTPDQYNANPAQVTAARALLEQARTDLKAAHTDAQNIRQALQGFNANPSSQSQNSTKSTTTTQ